MKTLRILGLLMTGLLASSAVGDPPTPEQVAALWSAGVTSSKRVSVLKALETLGETSESEANAYVSALAPGLNAAQAKVRMRVRARIRKQWETHPSRKLLNSYLKVAHTVSSPDTDPKNLRLLLSSPWASWRKAVFFSNLKISDFPRKTRRYLTGFLMEPMSDDSDSELFTVVRQTVLPSLLSDADSIVRNNALIGLATVPSNDLPATLNRDGGLVSRLIDLIEDRKTDEGVRTEAARVLAKQPITWAEDLARLAEIHLKRECSATCQSYLRSALIASRRNLFLGYDPAKKSKLLSRFKALSLDSSGFSTRIASMMALGHLASEDEDVQKHLNELVRQSQGEIRKWAVEALKVKPHVADVGALWWAVRDGEPEKIQAAFHALKSREGESPTEDLKTVFRVMTPLLAHSDPVVRKAAFEEMDASDLFQNTKDLSFHSGLRLDLIAAEKSNGRALGYVTSLLISLAREDVHLKLGISDLIEKALDAPEHSELVLSRIRDSFREQPGRTQARRVVHRGRRVDGFTVYANQELMEMLIKSDRENLRHAALSLLAHTDIGERLPKEDLEYLYDLIAKDFHRLYERGRSPKPAVIQALERAWIWDFNTLAQLHNSRYGGKEREAVRTILERLAVMRHVGPIGDFMGLRTSSTEWKRMAAYRMAMRAGGNQFLPRVSIFEKLLKSALADQSELQEEVDVRGAKEHPSAEYLRWYERHLKEHEEAVAEAEARINPSLPQRLRRSVSTSCSSLFSLLGAPNKSLKYQLGTVSVLGLGMAFLGARQQDYDFESKIQPIQRSAQEWVQDTAYQFSPFSDSIDNLSNVKSRWFSDRTAWRALDAKLAQEHEKQMRTRRQEYLFEQYYFLTYLNHFHYKNRGNFLFFNEAHLKYPKKFMKACAGQPDLPLRARQRLLRLQARSIPQLNSERVSRGEPEVTTISEFYRLSKDPKVWIGLLPK